MKVEYMSEYFRINASPVILDIFNRGSRVFVFSFLRITTLDPRSESGMTDKNNDIEFLASLGMTTQGIAGYVHANRA